jgi:hypothetical protein
MDSELETQMTLERRKQRLLKTHKNKKPSWINLANFFYFCCALLFTLIYFNSTVEYDRATLEALANFKAATPFQYRILVPYMVHIAHQIVPINVKHLYLVIILFFTLLLLIAFRRFMLQFLTKKYAGLCSLILLYPLFWNYCATRTYIYPSDIPAVFFFVLGIFFIYREKWIPYYLVFIVGSFNRETICFLTFAYLFTTFGKHGIKKMALHTTAQLAIWLLIRKLLAELFFSGYGARIFEARQSMKLFLRSILNPSPYGMLFLFSFGFIWLLIPLAWKKQPAYFKRLLLVLIPFFIGMAIVGDLTETRIYSELIPILTAPAIYGLKRKLET